MVAVLAVSIFFALPSNVLSLRDGGTARRVTIEVLPQGWAFFTKPPSESEAVVFILEGGRVVDVNRPQQAKVENWWGLSRRQRAQGPEVAQLVAQAKVWEPCTPKDSALACAATAASADQKGEPAQNKVAAPSVCGTAFVVETEPVRWSFRDYYEEPRRALQYAALEVSCP